MKWKTEHFSRRPLAARAARVSFPMSVSRVLDAHDNLPETSTFIKSTESVNSLKLWERTVDNLGTVVETSKNREFE